MKLKMDVDLDDIEARKMLGMNSYYPNSFYQMGKTCREK